MQANNFCKIIGLQTRYFKFEKADANYKNVVLEVMMPKMEKMHATKTE